MNLFFMHTRRSKLAHAQPAGHVTYVNSSVYMVAAIVSFSISRFHFPFFAAVFQFVLLLSIFALPSFIL